MPLYFIETIIGASRNPDLTGAMFDDADAAMKTALWALVDIVHDEAEMRTELEVTVVLKNSKGNSIFCATLQSRRQIHSEIRAEMPVPTEPPTRALHLSL